MPTDRPISELCAPTVPAPIVLVVHLFVCFSCVRWSIISQKYSSIYSLDCTMQIYRYSFSIDQNWQLCKDIMNGGSP